MNRRACPNKIEGVPTASGRGPRGLLSTFGVSLLAAGLLGAGCETLSSLSLGSKPAVSVPPKTPPSSSPSAASNLPSDASFGPRVQHVDVTTPTTSLVPPPALPGDVTAKAQPPMVLPGDVTVKAKPPLVTPKGGPETQPPAVATPTIVTTAPVASPAPRPTPTPVAVAHPATQLVKAQPEPRTWTPAVAVPSSRTAESIVLSGPQSENTRRARQSGSFFHLKWVWWSLLGIIGVGVASLSLAAVRGRVVEFVETRLQRAKPDPKKGGKFVIKLPPGAVPAATSITDTVLEGD